MLEKVYVDLTLFKNKFTTKQLTNSLVPNDLGPLLVKKTLKYEGNGLRK